MEKKQCIKGKSTNALKIHLAVFLNWASAGNEVPTGPTAGAALSSPTAGGGTTSPRGDTKPGPGIKGEAGVCANQPYNNQ